MSNSFRPRAIAPIAGVAVTVCLGVLMARAKTGDGAYEQGVIVGRCAAMLLVPAAVSVAAFFAIKRSNVAATAGWLVALAALGGIMFPKLLEEKNAADARAAGDDVQRVEDEEQAEADKYAVQLRSGAAERQARTGKAVEDLKASNRVADARAARIAQTRQEVAEHNQRTDEVQVVIDAWHARYAELSKNAKRLQRAFEDAGATDPHTLSSVEVIDQRILLANQMRQAQKNLATFVAEGTGYLDEEFKKKGMPDDERTAMLSQLNAERTSLAPLEKQLGECRSDVVAESLAILQYLKTHFGNWKYEGEKLMLTVSDGEYKQFEKHMRAVKQAWDRERDLWASYEKLRDSLRQK